MCSLGLGLLHQDVKTSKFGVCGYFQKIEGEAEHERLRDHSFVSTSLGDGRREATNVDVACPPLTRLSQVRECWGRFPVIPARNSRLSGVD